MCTSPATTTNYNTTFRLEHARKVLEVSRREFETKYFISNNGRLAPRLLRKLPNTTKSLYTESKTASSSNNANTKRTRRQRSEKPPSNERFKKQEQLIDAFNEEMVVAIEKLDTTEPILEEQLSNVEEVKEREVSEEEVMSEEFDETSSDEESASENSSNSSDDNNSREIKTRRRRRNAD